MKRIFFLGVGGSGMSSLAYLYAKKGAQVYGSDQNPEAITKPQEKGLITVVPSDDAEEIISTCDLLVFSDAVPANHSDRQFAQTHAIPQMAYQEALGEFTRDYTLIAVTGTHGKSSTTSFLAWILIEAGLDPTVLIGARAPFLDYSGARLGKSSIMIVEADEYRRHFLSLEPKYAVITSIDFDHPDYYTSMEDVQDAYNSFANKVPSDGLLVAPEELTSSLNLLKSCPASFLPLPDNEIPMPLPGEHMRQNANLAITICERLGIPRVQSIAILKDFPGLERRFETVTNIDSMRVVSDYGHHPAEIKATLTGARNAFPSKKIVALFECHMIERLQMFYSDFAEALSMADHVIVCPVFMPKGREGVSTEDDVRLFLKELTRHGVVYERISNFTELPTLLEKIAPEYPLAIGFSAGKLDAILRSL